MKFHIRNIAIAVGVIVLVGFIVISLSSNENKNIANDTAKMQAEAQPTATPLIQELKQIQEDTKRHIEESKAQLTNAPTPIISATSVANTDTASTKITDRINALVAEKYPNFEVTIWNQKADLAFEGQTPYEVILNGLLNKSIVADCDSAKRLSYYMLETFYKDDGIRPTLSRVMITIPYFLKVSLGASDGVPMEENSAFSGPTNFWKVMEKMGLGENETGEMKDRTWGIYLAKCE